MSCLLSKALLQGIKSLVAWFTVTRVIKLSAYPVIKHYIIRSLCKDLCKDCGQGGKTGCNRILGGKVV